ncbi:hypothetical protein FK514_27430, partial [Klebsiella pneumoniae]|nr:hypothetical protein [Klebsiella pneumoniae]
ESGGRGAAGQRRGGGCSAVRGWPAAEREKYPPADDLRHQFKQFNSITEYHSLMFDLGVVARRLRSAVRSPPTSNGSKKAMPTASFSPPAAVFPAP